MNADHRDILRSVEQMKAGKAARKTRVKVPAVVSTCISSGLAQAQFADLLGISVCTLQKWEQGAREAEAFATEIDPRSFIPGLRCRDCRRPLTGDNPS